MEFLKLLESIRTPALDQLFSLITHLGGEIALIVLALVVFWCVGKAQGLYLLTVGCIGTTVNQFLKITFRIPRPWIRDPSFTIVESARADAGGYSFPSGHTQNAFGVFGTIATMTKRRPARFLLWLLASLIAFLATRTGLTAPRKFLRRFPPFVCSALSIKGVFIHGGQTAVTEILRFFSSARSPLA